MRKQSKSLLRKPGELHGLILPEELPELVLSLGSYIVELARSFSDVESVDSPKSLDHCCFLADSILEDLKECGLLRRFNIRLLAEHRISNQHRGEVVEVVDRGRLHHGCFLL